MRDEDEGEGVRDEDEGEGVRDEGVPLSAKGKGERVERNETMSSVDSEDMGGMLFFASHSDTALCVCCLAISNASLFSCCLQLIRSSSI